MSDDLGLSFEQTLAEDLQDEAFREAYERLAPGFEVARLRMAQGMTQKQLAHLVGTRQSSISRLESGDREPSLSFLRRVAAALGAKVEVQLVALAEAVSQDTVSEDVQVRGLGVSRAASPQVAEEQIDYSAGDGCG